MYVFDPGRELATTDPNPPARALGCSTHWFDPNPTLRDSGVVAEGTYENGTRFWGVTPHGRILDLGYFLPYGGLHVGRLLADEQGRVLDRLRARLRRPKVHGPPRDHVGIGKASARNRRPHPGGTAHTPWGPPPTAIAAMRRMVEAR